jgi:hypothetical protein
MADTDISQAIRIIDEKITSLLEARNRLASAFGIEDKPPVQPIPAGRASKPVQTGGAAQSNGNGDHSVHPVGRKEQLAQFIQTHGPLSRIAIVEQSGIPEGTVSYCLNDKRFFQQSTDGDWDITEFSRRGLERRSKTGAFKELG